MSRLGVPSGGGGGGCSKSRGVAIVLGVCQSRSWCWSNSPKRPNARKEQWLLKVQPSSSLAAPLMTALLQVVSANLSARAIFGCRPRGLRLKAGRDQRRVTLRVYWAENAQLQLLAGPAEGVPLGSCEPGSRHRGWLETSVTSLAPKRVGDGQWNEAPGRVALHIKPARR